MIPLNVECASRSRGDGFELVMSWGANYRCLGSSSREFQNKFGDGVNEHDRVSVHLTAPVRIMALFETKEPQKKRGLLFVYSQESGPNEKQKLTITSNPLFIEPASLGFLPFSVRDGDFFVEAGETIFCTDARGKGAETRPGGKYSVVKSSTIFQLICGLVTPDRLQNEIESTSKVRKIPAEPQKTARELELEKDLVEATEQRDDALRKLHTANRYLQYTSGGLPRIIPFFLPKDERRRFRRIRTELADFCERHVPPNGASDLSEGVFAGNGFRDARTV